MRTRYDAWNRALAWRFFQGRATEPLYLYTDQAVLEEVAVDVGVDPGSAVGDFIASVRDTLGGSEPLAAWERWSRGDIADREVPRYVGVLCFLVMVAVERESTQFSYYPGLNRALGRSVDAGAPPGFDHHVATLFGRFNTWLAASGHGTPTAATSEHFPNIAWPLSQAIVRPTDRALLVRLFGAAGITPGLRHDSNWLSAQVWPRIITAPASASRTRIVDLAARHRETYLEVLRREYDAWDGSARFDVGPRRSLLRLCYEQFSGEWWLLGPALPGTSDTTFRIGTSSGAVRAGRSFEAVPAELWQLVGGGRVGSVAGGPDLESRARSVRWLTEDIRVGGWAEVIGRDVTVEQLALVRSGQRDPLSDKGAALRREDAPPGHRMYLVPRGVEVAEKEDDEAPVPPSGDPRLEGGLPLRRETQTYLACPTGPPVLVVAPGSRVEIDGVDVEVGSGRLELASIGLGLGPHQIVVGTTSIRFRLVRALHEQALRDVGTSWHTNLTSRGRVRVPHDRGSVYIVGEGGALVERMAVGDCRWVEGLDLMVTEADVTGLIRSTPFRPRFVVSPSYAGRTWVTRVPPDDTWTDGDDEAPPVDAVRARALVSTLLAGCLPEEVKTDREWRRALAALVRRVQAR